jgi:hypothetical protein
MPQQCGPFRRTPTPFAILGALLCASSLYAQTGPVVARAAGVTGQAVLTTPGAAALLLTPGYILTPGDRIDTRGGGRVVIDLSDGSMVVVAPESVVVLKDFRSASTLRELFEITLGAVRVKINHFAGKPNPYRMNTPTASIAVRGTEFSITVNSNGETEVQVVEGLVEVTALNDPARSVLLEAGRGVLIQLGQPFRLIGAMQPPPGGNRDGNDHGPNGRFGPPNQVAQQPPPKPDPDHGPQQMALEPRERVPAAPPGAQAKDDHSDHDEHSTQAPTGAYARYFAGLAYLGQAPFLLRYNAFSESHLDSLENPAYSAQFSSPEGRLVVLPTFRGTPTPRDYQPWYGSGNSVSPQFSYFAPAMGFTLGGSAGLSYLGDSSTLTTSTFYSGSLLAARRFGANSLGAEVSALKGTSEFESVNQTRLTVGYNRTLARATTFGAFYRYGFIHAEEGIGRDRNLITGHSAEAGLRLRGALTPRLFYGVTASWLGYSLSPNRAQRGALALGLGYALGRRTVLTLDLAGGTGSYRARFVSGHAAVQHDVTRNLFLGASLLQLSHSQTLGIAGNATSFSDYSAGWRFTPNLSVQYLFTTDYGVTAGTHSLLLRWTFRKE